MTRDRCQAVIEETAHRLIPAPPGAAEVEAARIVATLGLPLGVNPDAYSHALAEALEDLPPDLLALAGRRARTGCHWPPRPAEVRALVNDEMKRRVLVNSKARYGALKARED